MPSDLAHLLEQAADTIVSPWSSDGLKTLATMSPGQLSRNDWLLAGDARLLQLRWFIESVIPSDLSSKGPLAAAQLHQSSLDKVARVFPLLGKAERRTLAVRIAQLAGALMAREASGRTQVSMRTRRQLLVQVGDPPRCYLCGSRFTQAEIAYFLKESEVEPLPDVLVDFLYPRGANGRDRRIAVEHVRPVGDGGSSDPENLRLACYYCNTLKSDALTVYARGQYGRPVTHPDLGHIFPPNPLWVVRILALDGKCFECSISSDEAQLRVAPDTDQSISRYINPLALRVACDSHDPIKQFRFINRSVLK